jgi:3'-5' exoribonuclease
LIWNQLAIENKETQQTIDNVLHAILAHHGSREWGSPVVPLTKLAWMLHLCDGISARMDDAEI